MNILKISNNSVLQIVIWHTILLLSVSCTHPNTHTATNAVLNAEKKITPHPDTVVRKLQLYNLVYLNAPLSNPDSIVVFSRIDQGDVTIQKRYCDELDQPTRAILSYYAIKFSTGFDSVDNSLLSIALNSDVKTFDSKNLIKKWFKGSDSTKIRKANISAVLPDGASNSTWFTLIAIIKAKDMRRVYFRTLDTGDEINYREATDIFKIAGDHIQVISVHEFGEYPSKKGR